MADALADVHAFKLLLKGAHICEVIRPCRNRRKYHIHVRDKTAPSGWSDSGHITEGQFAKFAHNGIIEPLVDIPSRSDKYGNIYCYYGLSPYGDGESHG